GRRHHKGKRPQSADHEPEHLPSPTSGGQPARLPLSAPPDEPSHSSIAPAKSALNGRFPQAGNIGVSTGRHFHCGLLKGTLTSKEDCCVTIIRQNLWFGEGKLLDGGTWPTLTLRTASIPVRIVQR